MTSPAHAWCALVGLQTTKMFNLSLGRQASHDLAKHWAEKMEYLYSSHSEGLMNSEEGRSEVMDRFAELPEFQALASGEDERILREVAFIRSMSPRD